MSTKSYIEPPNTDRERHLPFHTIEPSESFEDFCRDVCKIAFPIVARAELKRKKGVAQYGVDVEGFNENSQPEIVISAKRYKSIKPHQLVTWTKEFASHLNDHWKDKCVKRFVLAVTVDGNSDQINTKIKECTSLLAKYDIVFEAWFNSSLTELARREGHLVRRYFPDFWDKSISARYPNTKFTESQIQQEQNLEEMVQLLATNNKLVSEKIDELQKKKRLGKPEGLNAYLTELTSGGVEWNGLDVTLQSRILRFCTLEAINKGEIISAKKHFQNSIILESPPDRSTEVWIVRHEHGDKAAIDFLSAPVSGSEYELLSALLIETNDFKSARKILSSTPNRAEKYRLMAALTCLEGDRQKAVELAIKSVSKEQNFRTRVMLLSTQVMASLCEGSELNLGASPNPFNPNLAKNTAVAIEYLDGALEQANILIETIDVSLRKEIEVWKYAILLCHPEKQVDARIFGSELILQPDPSATFVVWAIFSGLNMQHGRIKKYLGDKIRDDDCVTTDLVALALLTKQTTGTTAAKKVIESNVEKFPNDQQFLGEWISRFEDESEDVFVLAHSGLDAGFKNILAFVSSDSATVEQVLGAAQLLADKHAFSELDQLREKLLALSIPLSIELAALAASKIQNGTATIDILEENLSVFLNGELPTHLKYLKTRALEQAGLKASALAELERLNFSEPTSENRYNLIALARQTGNSAKMIEHSREYAKQKDATPEQLMTIAITLKNIEPDLTGKLLKRIAELPELPKELVAALFSMQPYFGDIETEFASRLQEKFGEFLSETDSIVQFDNAEDMMSYLEKKRKEYQEYSKGWLIGRMPAHNVFNSQEFVSLFLGKRENLRFSHGDDLPRLTTSNESRHPTIDKSLRKRRNLVLDLSALLLAKRYKIVDRLEEYFQIFIPSSLPPLLLDLKGDWQNCQLSSTDCNLLTIEFSKAPRTFSVRTAFSDNVINLIWPEKNDQKSLLAQTIIALESKGLATSKVIKNLRDHFKIETKDDVEDIHFGTLVLSGRIFIEFIRLGALEALSQLAEVAINRQDFDSLIDELQKSRDNELIFHDIENVVDLLQSRLSTETWLSLPENLSSQDLSEKSNIQPLQMILHECLNALATDNKFHAWIEDRYVSRVNLPNLINLNGLLHFFDGQNNSISGEIEHIEFQRLSDGHAFQKISSSEFLRHLSKASIDKGFIIETVDLENLRRGFCRQVLNLAYIDWGEVQDRDQSIVGEPRHALDFTKTLADVLEVVWLDDSISEERKIAMSQWAWTYLRIDNLRAKHVEQYNVSHYKSQLNASLVFLITRPLTSTLQNMHIKIEQFKGYFDWISSSILHPRFTIDPDFETDLLSRLVDLFCARFDSTYWKDNQDLSEQGNSVVALKIAELIELFPKNLRSKLYENTVLAKHLGVTFHYSVSTSIGVFDYDDLLNSVNHAHSSFNDNGVGTSSISSSDGADCDLSLSANLDGEVECTIKKDGQKIHVSGETLGCILNNTEIAEKIFRSSSLILELPIENYEQAILSLLSCKPGNDRIKCLNEFRSSDYSNTEIKFHQRIERDEELKSDDLRLPNPTSIANFIRFKLGQHEILMKDRLTQAEHLLHSEKGKFISVTRLAGSPFAIDFGAMVDDIPINEIDSCFQALSLSTLASTCNSVETEVSSICANLANSQIPLFTALVRSGLATADYDSAWKNCSFEERLLLVWIWADRVSCVFSANYEGTEPVVSWVKQSKIRTILSLANQRNEWGAMQSHGPGLTEAHVGAIFASDILQGVSWPDLPAAVQTTFLELAGDSHNGLWLPHIEVIINPLPVAIGLRSGADLAARMSAAEINVMDELRSFQAEQFISEVIANAVVSQDVLKQCQVLSACDIGLLTEQQKNELFELLQPIFTIDPPMLGEKTFKIVFALFAGICGDLNKLSALEAALEHLTILESANLPNNKLLAETQQSSGKDVELFEFLIDCLARGLLHADIDDHAKLSWMFDQLVLIIKRWPPSGPAVIHLADNLLRICPCSHALTISDKFCEIRIL